jgi:hypothetical protein
LSALFSLSDTLGIAEVIDDEEPGRPLHFATRALFGRPHFDSKRMRQSPRSLSRST